MKKIDFEKPITEKDLHQLYSTISSDSIKTILIKGSTGTGKSTLAKKIAHHFSIQHIEVDNLYWVKKKGDNVNPSFDKELTNQLQNKTYVIEGLWKFVKNFKQEGDFDLYIHLKLPRYIQLKRLILRDIKEVVMGKRKTLDSVYFLKNH